MMKSIFALITVLVALLLGLPAALHAAEQIGRAHV